jgi:hypothetical protein
LRHCKLENPPGHGYTSHPVRHHPAGFLWYGKKALPTLNSASRKPSIGYASFRKIHQRNRAGARAARMLVGEVVGGVAGLIASNPSTEYLLPIIMCVVFGVMAVWLGFRLACCASISSGRLRCPGICNTPAAPQHDPGYGSRIHRRGDHLAVSQVQ